MGGIGDHTAVSTAAEIQNARIAIVTVLLHGAGHCFTECCIQTFDGFLIRQVGINTASKCMVVFDFSCSVTNDQITSAQKLVDTYAIIIRSRPVLEPVIENLGSTMSVEKLANMVTVTSVNDTQVMQIAVRCKDPELALQIVEQIVDVCPTIIIDAVEAGSVKTIEPAYLNKAPVAPNTNLFAVVVAFLCMVVLVVVVILRFILDNTYKSEVDLRNDLGLPVLGVIPDYKCCMKQKNEGKEAGYYGKA